MAAKMSGEPNVFLAALGGSYSDGKEAVAKRAALLDRVAEATEGEPTADVLTVLCFLLHEFINNTPEEFRQSALEGITKMIDPDKRSVF